jgi:hypothetical protein
VYRVTIEQGPYAGEVSEGTTLHGAVHALRERCPGLTDSDVWWGYVEPDGTRHQCAVWGDHATNREPRELDEIHCRYCFKTLDGPDARYRYQMHHQRATCRADEVMG